MRPRFRVVDLRGADKAWKGVVAEVRARDADGALVSAQGRRFVPLWSAALAGDWESPEWTAELPEGTRQGQVCFRFVGTTGVLEVDALEVLSEGVPLPPAAAAMTLRWEMDAPIAAGLGPEGFEFFFPPGSRGATLKVGDLAEAGAKGIRFRAREKGNVVACSGAMTTGAGMVARARVRVDAIETDARSWTGFVMEMRTFDAIGALLPPGTGNPYTTLRAWKAVGDFEEVEVAFGPPDGAVSGKLCFRFVESTGEAGIDWAEVGGA